MKAIIRNMVGLFRFMGLLFLLIIPVPRTAKPRTKTPQEWDKPRDQDKYEAIIGPSKPLIPTETVFCPKCHALVCLLSRTREGIQIIQNGKVLVTVGGNIITTVDGKETKGFPIRCPNGHTVRIE